MAKAKDKWFDVPDSLVEEEQNNKIFKYYNVECRFYDHQVLDVAASQKARHNVHVLVPACMARIKRAAIGQPAIKNATPQVLRFDKGNALPREDFEAAMAVIARCIEAWDYYQLGRKAPVHDEEKIAVGLIERGPKPPIAKLFKRKMRQIVVDDDEEEEDDDDGEEAVEAVGAGPEAGSSGGKRAPASDAPKAAKGAGKPPKAAAKKPSAKKRAA
jgi:hypothetical protein